jgi:integrase
LIAFERQRQKTLCTNG